MKKIGLIGGMSWESSLIYYQLVNQLVKKSLGGLHSAKCIMESVDFAEIEKFQHKGDWDALNQIMVNAAKNLENAQADIVILCTNTMHLCSEAITQNIKIPFLHIAEATAMQIQKEKIDKVLLLGTKFTMEKDFYKSILNNHGIEVMIPNESDRQIVHNVIYNELVLGKFLSESREKYQFIIHKAMKNGAKGVVLGCTEIPLLIKQNDVNIPIFDTTTIHAKSAVDFALN